MPSRFKRIVINRATQRLNPFYKRYPFTSPVSIRSANDRGCVELEMGFFYNRIPKAANSSVMTALAQLKCGHPVPSKAAKTLFQSPASLSREEIYRFDQLFKFAIVRNPFSRTLSAYLDKVERRAKARNHESSFEGFVSYLEQGGLYRNAHWAPQTALLLIPVERFDFVGKVERYAEDWAEVLRSLQGLSSDVALTSGFFANATGADAKLLRYYTPSLVKRIAQIYRADFEAFGYDAGSLPAGQRPRDG
jgi:hypothetical protein